MIMLIYYAQSAYQEFGLRRVWLKQTLNSKGWEFSCPLKFIGSLPESLTQGLLVGKLLVGGLGVFTEAGWSPHEGESWQNIAATASSSSSSSTTTTTATTATTTTTTTATTAPLL